MAPRKEYKMVIVLRKDVEFSVEKASTLVSKACLQAFMRGREKTPEKVEEWE